MSEKHTGSCHCGAVRFVVHADLSQGASKCNCSICLKLGAIGRIVKPSDNLNCLDDVDPNALKLGHHDNWRAGVRDQPWPI